MFDSPTNTLIRDDEGPLGVLRELARAARAAAEVDWSAESSLDLVEAAKILTQVTNQLVATDAGAVEAYARSGDWRLDGHRSPTAGLETETGTSTGRARKRVAVARNSVAMPATVAALREGDLGLEHQRVLADALATARRAGDEAAFERDEKLLVEHARRLDFDAFRTAIEGWKACVDPDGA